MRPFSENAQCMKCGGREVGTTWHPGFDCKCEDATGEHMSRYCRQCGFHWIEASLNLLVPTEAPK